MKLMAHINLQQYLTEAARAKSFCNDEKMFVLQTRVESGLDDPDNLCHLGHIFGGSSGSHLQAKLSGCDPDISHFL